MKFQPAVWVVIHDFCTLIPDLLPMHVLWVEGPLFPRLALDPWWAVATGSERAARVCCHCLSKTHLVLKYVFSRSSDCLPCSIQKVKKYIAPLKRLLNIHGLWKPWGTHNIFLSWGCSISTTPLRAILIINLHSSMFFFGTYEVRKVPMNWLAWDLVTIQIFRKNMFDTRSFPPWNMKHERRRSTTVKGQILASPASPYPKIGKLHCWLVAPDFFRFSTRSLGKWSNLTNIFFRWVGSTTNQIVESTVISSWVPAPPFSEMVSFEDPWIFSG